MGKTHPVFFSAVLLSTSTAKTCLLSPSSYPVCRRRKNGVCKLWWRWWWWSRHPFFSIIYSFKNFLFCKNLKKYSSAFSTQAVLVFWLVVLQNIPPTHTHSAGWKFSIFFILCSFFIIIIIQFIFIRFLLGWDLIIIAISITIIL